MGYWGWRPFLFVFISVWVVGCSTTQDATPTQAPTYYPPVTLTTRRLDIRTPQPPPLTTPGPLLYELIYPLHMDTLPGSAHTPTPSPPDTTICHPMPTDSVLCMGRVRNQLANTLGAVHLRVTLLHSESGDVLEVRSTTTEQRAIPPGGAAPYHIVFRQVGGVDAMATAAIQQAQPESDAVALPVENTRFELMSRGQRYAHYQLSADVLNPNTYPVHAVRAIVTLLDDTGHVAGYRAADIGELLTDGERLSFQMEVTSYAHTTGVRHVLHVEALPGDAHE